MKNEMLEIRLEGREEKLAYIAGLEGRIRAAMQGAYSNLLEVGRCLASARDSGIIPHGEWEEWVRRNTGFSARQAQRLMHAARNVPEGSALAALPISKIQEILTLPEGERETAAERVAQENLTIRQLRAELATARGDRDAAEREKQAADAEVGKLRTRMQAQADINGKIKEALAEAEARREAAESEVAALDRQLQARAAQTRPDGAASDAARAEIAALKQALADAQEYAAQQAELRAEAQRRALNLEAARDGGDRARETGPMEALAAIRSFIAEAGVMPHMGAQIAALDARDRECILQHVRMVEDWVEGVRAALMCNVCEGEFA